MSRKLNRCIHLAGFALALSACGSNNDGAGTTKTVTRVEIPASEFKPVELEDTINTLVKEIGKTPPKQLQLGVVLKDLTGYWEPVKVGSNRAFGELGVSGVVLAPVQGTPDEATQSQVQLLQDRENAGYDGIGVAPLAQVVSDEINNFEDQGTPVVTIDSDQADSKRQLYVGTANYEAGSTAGQTLVNMLAGGAGTVIVLGTTDNTWVDGVNRTQGAVDVLQAAGYTVNVHTTDWTDDGQTQDVADMTDLLQNSDPPAVGMISMFSPTFLCARAAEAAGLGPSDVTIVGFDFEPETLSYMQSGLIKATHAQRQYYMGYLVPYVLYSFKALGAQRTLDILSPEMIDTSSFNSGIDVVSADKVDAYNAFLDSLGITG
jgi:ribose transport system substrate-binding protein